MTAAEMKAAPHDFLEKNLIERTRKGPAVWDMIVYVGEAGDPLDNPTLAWPETRKHFTAGTLTHQAGGASAEGHGVRADQLRSAGDGRRHCADQRSDPAVSLAGLCCVVREASRGSVSALACTMSRMPSATNTPAGQAIENDAGRGPRIEPLADGAGEVTQQAEQHGGLGGERHAQRRDLPGHVPLARDHELRQERKEEQNDLAVDGIGQYTP